MKQTRFEDETKNEASLKNIHVRINAMVIKKSLDTDKTARAQVYDPECKEIAILPIIFNDAFATAIIDPGSPATVISKGLYERMGE